MVSIRLWDCSYPNLNIGDAHVQSLLVCYISGTDLRRIDPEATPFLAGAMASNPWTVYRNLPSNELFRPW